MVKHNLRAFLRHPLLAGEAGVNHPFRIALIDCPSRRVSAGPPGANWLAVLSSRGRIHWQAEPTRRNGWDGAAILTPGQGTPLTGGEGMEIEEFVKRRTDAAEEFNLHEGRSDGVEIAGSLAGGLTILRDCSTSGCTRTCSGSGAWTRSWRRSRKKRANGWPRSKSSSTRSPSPPRPPAPAIMPTASPIGIGSGWRGCGWDRRSRMTGSPSGWSLIWRRRPTSGG